MTKDSKDATAPNLGGRPTKFKPEYVEQARKLCLIGAIDEEIADFFEVTRSTLSEWKLRHPEFLAALKLGKDAVDDKVERSLLQMALGYEQDEVKIFMPAGAAEPVYAPFRAKIPPNATAAIFFLKNRRSKDWRDKQEIEHGGVVKHEVSIDEYRAARAEIIDEA